jgi:hypothetical protein
MRPDGKGAVRWTDPEPEENPVTRSFAKLSPFALALLLSACSESSSGGMTFLGSGQAGAVTVQLYTDTQLQTGLSPVYAKLTDASGVGITAAIVSFAPTMTMTGGGTHTAPVVGPVTLNNQYLFQDYVVFPMPSGTSGSWSMKVHVQLPGQADAFANFPSLPVAASGNAATFTSGATNYLLSMNLKSPAIVGQNPIAVTLFSTADAGMTWAPIDNGTFVLLPCVPSASHCSAGSVSPVLQANGVYNGSLNFDRSGNWVTTVQVSQAGTRLGDGTFATSF